LAGCCFCWCLLVSWYSRVAVHLPWDLRQPAGLGGGHHRGQGPEPVPGAARQASPATAVCSTGKRRRISSIHTAQNTTASIHTAQDTTASIHTAQDTTASIHTAQDTTASNHTAQDTTASIHADRCTSNAYSVQVHLCACMSVCVCVCCVCACVCVGVRRVSAGAILYLTWRAIRRRIRSLPMV
jgi:hypothetical protein